MSHSLVYDKVFATTVRKYGFRMAVRFARNIGIDFVDCYYMAFGKFPR